MSNISLQEYSDRHAHARIDALESSLSRLAVSVEHLATKVDASYNNLSDKLSGMGRTDWRALLAGVSTMIALIALAGALVVRTVESGNLQLGERQAAQRSLHDREMEWLVRMNANMHDAIDDRLDDLQQENKEADADRLALRILIEERTRDRFTWRDYREQEGK